MPKIDITFSVIIPNFNNGKTLKRAVESCLSQTHSPKDIVVVDDGSTDDSMTVLESFGDKIKFVSQKNGGVSAARNRGVEEASGDWITFLDADDCFLPNRLQAHADWIHNDDKVEFLLGDQEQRDASGRLLYHSISSSELGKSLLKANPGLKNIPLTKKDFYGLISNGFGEIRTLSVRRNTFLQIGGFPIGRKVGEDLHLLTRICEHCNYGGVVNEPLAIYYLYDSSVLRRDVAAAQINFVETLDLLAEEYNFSSPYVENGLREKRRLARLSLSYVYLRQRKRMQALLSALPILSLYPSWKGIRDILSILKGL